MLLAPVAIGEIGVIRSLTLRTALVSYVEWSKARWKTVSHHDETYYRATPAWDRAISGKAAPAASFIEAKFMLAEFSSAGSR